MTQQLAYRDDFPHRVESIETIWIPLSDGSRLAAKLWLPEQAESHPVPAILEYIPYRRRDSTRLRDSTMHPYVAGHGYACVRVDLRGSGDSDGVLTDEYLQQELDDGVEVIEWLAEQAWCSGQVGMIGISWGGFNGLQIAALQPSPLQAVISVCSTDDRYADDIHHMGGCLLGDNLSWASVMFAYNSLPPDPEVVGERWREMWMQRLQESGLWLSQWLQHQRRDEYWKHGSICEDYTAVQCPVLAVSGWADGYSNTIFRLLENLPGPRQGLIGPWSHKYPHLGVPGPAIGFLQECVRWWDRWLKGIENRVEQEPMLRVWMQDSMPPTSSYPLRPGRWVSEPAWPSDAIQWSELRIAHHRLRSVDTQQDETSQAIPARDQVADDESPYTLRSPLTVGLFAGKWCSYAAGPDLAHDQRQEDGGALVFDSLPLEEPIEILGAPFIELVVSSDQPLAMLAARLSDVQPDDKVTRVSYGLLNLTHRESSEFPSELEPHRKFKVRLNLNSIAQRFPAGHRLRLALSTSYWPLAWAPPKPVRLMIDPQELRFHLPIRQPQATDEGLRSFDPPEAARPETTQVTEPEHHNWLVHRDLASDCSTLEVINESGVRHLPSVHLEVRNDVREEYSSIDDDFTSLRGEVTTIRGLRRGDWDIQTRTRTVLTCSAEHFFIQAELDAYEGDKRVFSESWDEAIPRDFV